MKKVVYGVILIAVFGLTACGNDKKEMSSSSKVEQSTKLSTKESSKSTSSTSVESSSETPQSTAVIQATQLPESEVSIEETVPSSAEQPVQSSEPQQAIYDEVQPGESTYHVAQRNGISLEQLFELNGLDENSGVASGDKLRVK